MLKSRWHIALSCSEWAGVIKSNPESALEAIEDVAHKYLVGVGSEAPASGTQLIRQWRGDLAKLIDGLVG